MVNQRQVTTLKAIERRMKLSEPAQGPADNSMSPGMTLWRLFRRNRSGLAGAVITLFVLIMTLAAPWLAPLDPFKFDLPNRLQSPSAEHVFGTDGLGRDIYSRVIHGARISLGVGAVSVIVGCGIGVAAGGLGAYLGGWYDEIVMRVLDVVLAFPAILLGLAIVAVLGPSIWNVAFAVGLVSIPRFARVVRSAVLSLKERDFVASAVAIGCNHARVFWRHILPNCLTPLLVMATLYMGTSIITASSLSFLGMGIQPPTPEWGNMLAEARDFVRAAPHVGLFPGLAITLAVVGLNLLGNGLRDAFDPSIRRSWR